MLPVSAVGRKNAQGISGVSGYSSEKKHDLISLHKTCIEQEPEFSVLKEACADLNVYAVEARYPSSLELTSNDAEKAIRDAERIWYFVSLRLPDR